MNTFNLIMVLFAVSYVGWYVVDLISEKNQENK